MTAPQSLYDYVLQVLCEEAVALTYTEQGANWITDMVVEVVSAYNKETRGSK